MPIDEAGDYRFETRTDDGVRLTVDGDLVIDEWYPMPATTHEATVSLSAGTHTVLMDYFENGGVAIAELSWAPVE